MADNIDASAEFNGVRSTVISESNSITSFLTGIASGAAGHATAYLTTSAIAGESGSAIVADITPPTEPLSDDMALYTGVTTFLDWLYNQQLQAATFPSYVELFPDEPASAPQIDKSTPSTFVISGIERPNYTAPTWDDGSAWSGGNIDDDPALGTLSAPFVWTERSYTSQLMRGGVNALYSLVKQDLESSDYGIDALDDGRLWDRAQERENRAAAQAVAGATRLFSAGGFTQPTGAAQAAIDKILSEARDKVSSLSREVMIKKADMYLEAKKIALANGLEVEKTTMSFYSTEQDRLLKRLTQEITSTVEVATFNIERIKLLVTKYEAYAKGFAAQVEGATGIVKMYEAEVSAEKTKAEANSAIWAALSAKNKNIIDGFVAQLQGFQTVMDARVKYHGVLADVYKTQVSQANTIADVSKGAYDLLDKQQKNIVDFRLGKYNGQVAQSKQQVDEILGFLQVKVDQLKNDAQVFATKAAAAMSALNVNLGMSLSANTSLGASENHSYDKTKTTRPGESESTTNYYYHDKTKGNSEGTRTSYNHNYSYQEY